MHRKTLEQKLEAVANINDHSIKAMLDSMNTTCEKTFVERYKTLLEKTKEYIDIYCTFANQEPEEYYEQVITIAQIDLPRAETLDLMKQKQMPLESLLEEYSKTISELRQEFKGEAAQRQDFSKTQSIHEVIRWLHQNAAPDFITYEQSNRQKQKAAKKKASKRSIYTIQIGPHATLQIEDQGGGIEPSGFMPPRREDYCAPLQALFDVYQLPDIEKKRGTEQYVGIASATEISLTSALGVHSAIIHAMFDDNLNEYTVKLRYTDSKNMNITGRSSSFSRAYLVSEILETLGLTISRNDISIEAEITENDKSKAQKVLTDVFRLIIAINDVDILDSTTILDNRQPAIYEFTHRNCTNLYDFIIGRRQK